MFPEDKWPPPERWAEAYWQCVADGRHRIQANTVAFLGLARDVAKILPKTIERITHLGNQFREHKVLVYENDSKDSTKAILTAWEETTDNVQIWSEQLGRPRIGGRDLLRVRRLAEYRGRLREEWLKQPTDYVIVVDLDLQGGFSADGVAHTIGSDYWDFMGANGLIWAKDHWRQFDAWAFRRIKHPQPHTPEQISPIVPPRGAPLMPVESCFGGLGVYTRRAFETGSYSGGDDIEHACFHRSLRKAGMRLFMNPSQLVIYEDQR